MQAAAHVAIQNKFCSRFNASHAKILRELLNMNMKDEFHRNVAEQT